MPDSLCVSVLESIAGPALALTFVLTPNAALLSFVQDVDGQFEFVHVVLRTCGGRRTEAIQTMNIG